MVRSQVMRDFRRKTKKPKINPEDRFLTILPLPQSDAAGTGSDEQFINHLGNVHSEALLRDQDGLFSEAGMHDRDSDTYALEMTRMLHLASRSKQSLRSTWPVPRTICGRNDAVDPFNSTATKIDNWTHNVVQYYINKLTPDCFIAESRPSRPAPDQFKSAIHARVQACLSSELHMYSVMASCTSRMRRFECVEPKSRETSPEYFVDKAVSALRLKLEAKPAAIDTFTLLDILSLSVAETFMHNHKAAATHLLLIGRLGAQMGGLKQFDPFLRELFSVGDINLGLSADSRPILALEWSEWKQESLPAQRMAEISRFAQADCSLPALEPGTLPGWDSSCFSATIFCIVKDLATFLQAAQYVWNQPHSMPGDRQWIFLRGSGIIHRLLSLKGVSDHSSPKPEVEECCRIALLILSHAVVGHARARQFMKVWAPRLKAALLRSTNQQHLLGVNLWLGRHEILAWVISAGLFVAEGTSEIRWFVSKITKTLAMNANAIRAAYKRFLQALFFLEDETRERFLRVLK
jgi:hypothetical protein